MEHSHAILISVRNAVTEVDCAVCKIYSEHSLLFSDGRTDVQLSSVKHQVVGLFLDNFLCIFHGFKCHKTITPLLNSSSVHDDLTTFHGSKLTEENFQLVLLCISGYSANKHLLFHLL